MKVALVSPQLNFIDWLADYLVPAEKNFDRVWIIFPEKRPGYYLRQALAKKLGRSYLPPRLFSFDEFIDFLYTEILHFSNPLVEPIDAVALLFELNTRADTAKSRHSFLTLDEFFAFGQKLFHDLEELKSGQVSDDYFTVLDALSGEKLPDKTKARLGRLSDLYREFYEHLEKDNLSTRATRLEKIVDELQDQQKLMAADQIIFCGFFKTTRAEARLLQNLLQLKKTSLYLFDGPGIEEVLNQLGIDNRQVEKIEESGGKTGEPEISFYLSPDIHGQILMLNQILAERIQRPSLLDEKTAIILPAMESLIPLYQQTLQALPEDSFNISLGYPLTRTPLYNFFDCLFNLIQSADEEQRLYAPYYLDFVLHPYTKNIYFPEPYRSAELTRILFHTLQETMNRKKGRLFWSLSEITSDPELWQELDRQSQAAGLPKAPEFLKHLEDIHQKTIEPFFQLKNVKEFAEKLIRLLDYLSAHSTARLHLFFQPYAQEFYQQFEHLKKSRLSRQRFQHLYSYFSLFRKIMAQARVSFTGTPLHGLQVLGFWETRALNFKEIFLLDMNDDLIPGRNKVDSLLPYALRKELGLTTHEEIERKYRYYLHLLLAAAEKAHLFFVENSEKEKSRYVEELIWEKQKKWFSLTGQKQETLSLIKSTTYRIALQSITPQPVSKSSRVIKILLDKEYTATQLDCYLKCPLQFYYAYVLKLSEKEELTETPERTKIGSLVHQILYDYFIDYLGQNLPAKLDSEKLERIIENNFLKNFSEATTGSFYLMKKQIDRHLKDFLKNYQTTAVCLLAQANMNLKLLALETKLKTEHLIGKNKFQL
ncbi:MAG: PD-(D/E)XK nuclease family protein, partial [Candidatus Aminicenantes bacterium]|nr:PD-(D/E)XK nuclease family protein [Candidatus Aminicenantes bacterium]